MFMLIAPDILYPPTPFKDRAQITGTHSVQENAGQMTDGGSNLVCSPMWQMSLVGL